MCLPVSQLAQVVLHRCLTVFAAAGSLAHSSSSMSEAAQGSLTCGVCSCCRWSSHVRLCSLGPRGSAGAGFPPVVHELCHGQATYFADIPAQGERHLSFSVNATFAGISRPAENGALLLHLSKLLTCTSHLAPRFIKNEGCKAMCKKPLLVIAPFTWLAALSLATVIGSCFP